MHERQHKLAAQVYQYMSGRCKMPVMSSPADVAIVFTRADISIAQAAAEVYQLGLATQFVVSGGVGKDSGSLPELGLTEARFLTAVMTSLGVPRSAIIMEEAAKNGAQNSQFSMNIIRERGLLAGNVLLIGHRTNLWRVYLAHLTEAKKLGFEAKYHLVAPSYQFGPADTAMMLGELDRLIEWPKKAWADSDPDLPNEVVAEFLQLKESVG